MRVSVEINVKLDQETDPETLCRGVEDSFRGAHVSIGSGINNNIGTGTIVSISATSSRENNA